MAKLKPNQFLLDGHLITELPILFQTEMVQSILEDRKTQTRRGKGLDEVNVNSYNWQLAHVGDVSYNDLPKRFGAFFYNLSDPKRVAFKPCPYGQPGDLLWLKETWAPLFDQDGEQFGIAHSTDTDIHPGPWEPSIHMPKSAARIWLIVEEIRVERVRDISEQDSKAEGVQELDFSSPHFPKFRDYNPQWARKTGGVPICKTAQKSFQTLWISIKGEDSWKSNPWVWVIRFRVLSKTGRPSNEAILAARHLVLGSQISNLPSHV